MKSSFVFFIVFVFISIGIFGFLGITHAEGHGECIASTMQGVPCPNADPFGFASFHISALKSFGEALTGSVFILTLFTFFVFLLFGFWIQNTLLKNKLIHIRSALLRSSRFQQTFLRWISLHETSPTYV